MSKILIPALSPDDWKGFLADPDKHWKTGYSAKTLAYCWQESGGMPPEVTEVLKQVSRLRELDCIFAIPEHKVPLPGGVRASQNDVWVLAKSAGNLVSIAVEGKVSESFGPIIGEWFKSPSTGKGTRLRFLCDKLEIEFQPPNNIRYQLLHRTVSAILEAERFNANEAVMVVHSFSKTDEWLEDYQNFLSLFGLSADIGEPVSQKLSTGMNLTFAWVHGSERFLEK